MATPCAGSSPHPKRSSRMPSCSKAWRNADGEAPAASTARVTTSLVRLTYSVPACTNQLNP
ncbi:Uncharacterised protein [Bordetella pertussis]|nr:Uncharacterised protein [Bordetella pertussis]CFW34329.1 Uncharacterised protein [Bordetella pertussis]CPN39625.1 Uncharacterised protein [Bordetella pertussis]